MTISSSLNVANQLLHKYDLSCSPVDATELLTRETNLDTKGILYGKIRNYHRCGLFVSLETITTERPLWEQLDIEGEHFLIICHLQGERTVMETSENPKKSYPPGTVVRIHQQTAHCQLAIEGNTANNRFLMALSTSYLRELLENEPWFSSDVFLNSPLFGRSMKEECYYLGNRISSLIYEMIDNPHEDPFKKHFLEMKVKELFFIFHTSRQHWELKPGVPKEISEKLIKAKSLLIAQFIDPPTIRQLSREISLNEFKLKKYFKEVFGTTIYAMVLQLRMERAMELLLTKNSVAETAIQTGYRSISHFILAFKKFYGDTPKKVQSYPLTPGNPI